jgi:hypothetical protein
MASIDLPYHEYLTANKPEKRNCFLSQWLSY